MKSLRLEYALSLLLLFTGCGDGNDGGIADSQTEIPEEWLEDAVDCLNGHLIISCDNGYGIIDTTGHVVANPLYSELFFLTDDIAAGYEAGYWNFINSDGNVIARVEGKDSDNMDSLIGYYRNALNTQNAVWEDIVERYEDFCARCAAEDVDTDSLKASVDRIMTEASCAEGFMSDVQRRRVEQAYSKYRMGGVVNYD